MEAIEVKVRLHGPGEVALLLQQEGDAHHAQVDAGLAHEVDAEERDQAHARRDRDEIRRDDDADAPVEA